MNAPIIRRCRVALEIILIPLKAYTVLVCTRPTLPCVGGLRASDCTVTYSFGYRWDAPSAPSSQPVQLRSPDGALSFSLTLLNGWDVSVNVGALPSTPLLTLTYLNGTTWVTARNVTVPPASACIRAVPAVTLWPLSGSYVGSINLSFSLTSSSGSGSISGGGGYTVAYAISGAVSASGTLALAPQASANASSGLITVSSPGLTLVPCGAITVTAIALHPGMQASAPATASYTIVSDPSGQAACLGQRALPAAAPASAASEFVGVVNTAQLSLLGALRDPGCNVLIRLRAGGCAANSPTTTTATAVFSTFRLLRTDDGGSVDATLTVPLCYDTLLSLGQLPGTPTFQLLQFNATATSPPTDDVVADDYGYAEHWSAGWWPVGSPVHVPAACVPAAEPPQFSPGVATNVSAAAGGSLRVNVFSRTPGATLFIATTAVQDPAYPLAVGTSTATKEVAALGLADDALTFGNSPSWVGTSCIVVVVTCAYR